MATRSKTRDSFLKYSDNYFNIIKKYLHKYHELRKHVNWDILREMFLALFKYEKKLVSSTLTRYTNIKLIEYIIENYLATKRGKKHIFEHYNGNLSKAQWLKVCKEIAENIDIDYTEKLGLSNEYITEIVLSLRDKKNIELLKKLYPDSEEYIRKVLEDVKTLINLRKYLEEVAIATNIGFIDKMSKKAFYYLKKNLRLDKNGLPSSNDMYIEFGFAYAITGFIQGLRKMKWDKRDIVPLTCVGMWTTGILGTMIKRTMKEHNLYKNNFSLDEYVFDDNEKRTVESNVSYNIYNNNGNYVHGIGVSSIKNVESEALDNVFIDNVINKLRKSGIFSEDEIEEVRRFLSEDGYKLPRRIKYKLSNSKIKNILREMLCHR